MTDNERRVEGLTDKRRNEALKSRFLILINQLSSDIRDIRVMLHYLDIDVEDELRRLDKELTETLMEVRTAKKQRGII